jgi:hypothetical protein
MFLVEKHVDHLVDRYAFMAMQQGWLVYVRHRVAALQKEDKMYADLGVRIKKRMDEMKANDD